jgi:hypothetical protein
MEKPFKIKSFAWTREIADITERAGHAAKSDDDVLASLISLARFLEERNLVRRKLLENGKLIGGKGFELWSSDLTDQGIAVIRAGLSKWEKGGPTPTDVRPLERAYAKVTAKHSSAT